MHQAHCIKKVSLQDMYFIMIKESDSIYSCFYFSIRIKEVLLIVNFIHQYPHLLMFTKDNKDKS